MGKVAGEAFSPVVLKEPQVADHKPDQADNVERISNMTRQLVHRLIAVLLSLSFQFPPHLKAKHKLSTPPSEDRARP